MKIRTASYDDFSAILRLQKGSKHTVGFLSERGRPVLSRVPADGPARLDHWPLERGVGGF
jgi:hypothetical protein